MSEPLKKNTSGEQKKLSGIQKLFPQNNDFTPAPRCLSKEAIDEFFIRNNTTREEYMKNSEQ